MNPPETFYTSRWYWPVLIALFAFGAAIAWLVQH
jgi:hypothetical protein